MHYPLAIKSRYKQPDETNAAPAIYQIKSLGKRETVKLVEGGMKTIEIVCGSWTSVNRREYN
jgi:hypothetical protein